MRQWVTITGEIQVTLSLDPEEFKGMSESECTAEIIRIASSAPSAVSLFPEEVAVAVDAVLDT